MSSLWHGLRWLVELLLYPFDALPPQLGLTLLSVVTGIGMLWVVGKTTPQARVEVARRRIASAIYEIRLFLDSPKRVFASQGRMLGWSVIYVVYLLPAFVVLALPLGLLYLHLEIRYGLGPLETGEPHVVRVALEGDVDGYGVEARGDGPVRVTAVPLYDAEDDVVYFRVVIDEPGTHELVISSGEHEVTKRLVAEDSGIVSPERRRGIATLWTMSAESPLPDGPIAAVTVAHPGRDQRWLGLGWPWWLFWLVVATIAALAFRRTLDVEL